MKTTELAIVGAGRAGLSAAAEAARHGVSVVLLDDNQRPGPVARELFSASSHPRVEFLTGAVVWGAPEARTLAFTHTGRADRVRAQAIIVAAGAVDRAVPFPGWTLPGVMTAAEARDLVESGAVRPCLRALVVGTGPLLPVVAQSLRRAGATVAAVLDAAFRGPVRRAVPRRAAPGLFQRRVAYRVGLAGPIPLRCGWTVIEARGLDRVSEAEVAPVDRAGDVDRARARAIRVDAIVTSFGRVPATELTRLLGCVHEWRPARGGWIPSRSEDLETSVPGVFAVGDGAGIVGVEAAVLEGRLAGLVVASRLGRCPPADAGVAAHGLRTRLERLARFRAGLDARYAPPGDFLSLLTADTIVCRCEGVTAGQLLAGLSRGLASINALKGATRITMGICQGRNCLGTLADLVARERGCVPADLAYPQSRPPARPVRLGDVLGEDLSPAASLAATPP